MRNKVVEGMEETIKKEITYHEHDKLKNSIKFYFDMSKLKNTN